MLKAATHGVPPAANRSQGREPDPASLAPLDPDPPLEPDPPLDPEVLDPELPLEPELLLDPEVLDSELPLEPEPPLEPDPPLELDPLLEPEPLLEPPLAPELWPVEPLVDGSEEDEHEQTLAIVPMLNATRTGRT